MEKKITDLLDLIQDDTVQLHIKDVASIKKIQEATMKKINLRNNNGIKRKVRKLGSMIAVAAIALVFLAGTGFAINIFGIADYFKGYFAALTDSQIAVMYEIGRTDMQAVTSNGTTITPLASIGDDSFYYLALRIEAPESIVFEQADGYFQVYNPHEPETLNLLSDSNGGYEINATWYDDTPGDNIIEVVLQFTAQYGSDLKFNDGNSKVFKLCGLWLQSPEKEYVKILDGEWVFDIGLSGISGMLELDVTGKTASGDGGCRLTLETMSVSPLGIQFAYMFDYSENITPGPGTFCAVMKDGTKIDAEFQDCIVTAAKQEGRARFASPVNVKELDYIQFGDLKIPVNIN